MKNISEFSEVVRYARKRTGVIFADDEFSVAIKALTEEGYKLTDVTSQFDGKLFLTVDQLVGKLVAFINNEPILILNLELFIAPRLTDGRFVEELARKLVVLEPKQPIVLLFYSLPVYKTFSTIYQLTLQNQQHTLDLTEENP